MYETRLGNLSRVLSFTRFQWHSATTPLAEKVVDDAPARGAPAELRKESVFMVRRELKFILYIFVR